MWIYHALSTYLNIGYFDPKTNPKQLVLYVIKVRVIHVELRPWITFILFAVPPNIFPRHVDYFHNMFFYRLIVYSIAVHN